MGVWPCVRMEKCKAVLRESSAPLFMFPAGHPGWGALPALWGRPSEYDRVQEFLRKSLFDFPLPTATMKVSFQKNFGDPEKGRCT